MYFLCTILFKKDRIHITWLSLHSPMLKWLSFINCCRLAPSALELWHYAVAVTVTVTVRVLPYRYAVTQWKEKFCLFSVAKRTDYLFHWLALYKTRENHKWQKTAFTFCMWYDSYEQSWFVRQRQKWFLQK